MAAYVLLNRLKSVRGGAFTPGQWHLLCLSALVPAAPARCRIPVLSSVTARVSVPTPVQPGIPTMSPVMAVAPVAVIVLTERSNSR